MKIIRTGAAHDALDQVDKALAKINGTGPFDEQARRAAADALDELDALARYVEDIRTALIHNLRAIPDGVDTAAQVLAEGDAA